MYFIPGTSGHANIYKNLKGERFKTFYKTLYQGVVPSNVDFGVSIYPKGL